MWPLTCCFCQVFTFGPELLEVPLIAVLPAG
jgi:hypothetical protein